MKNLILLTFLVVMVGCSSVPKSPTPENTEDKVIARIDDMGSRPSWVHESEPFKIEGGTVTSLGITTLPGDSRVEAGYRIAQNNAKGAIAGAIGSRLEFVFQNAEEGTSIDSTQARYIGSEASNLTTSSMRMGKQYWEKVASTTDSGERITRYKVFSTVTMPEGDFKRAMMAAIQKAEGKGGLSKDFADRVNTQWDKFTGNVPTPTEKPTESAKAE